MTKMIKLLVCRGCEHMEPCVLIPTSNISKDNEKFYVPCGCPYNSDDCSWKIETCEDMKISELLEKMKE